jgi:membrane protein insertase Oxa1/YidC/SpoIIIJ
MSLQNLLDLSESRSVKQGLSEERLKEQIPHLRKLISFYREYPDYLVDFMKGPDSTFQFYFYQRIFLRVVMRHRYVYATFPRAYSKSFLSMMVLMLRCILYPNSQLFVTTGGKEQAASITIAKIEEICKLIPALNNEIK